MKLISTATPSRRCARFRPRSRAVHDAPSTRAGISARASGRAISESRAGPHRHSQNASVGNTETTYTIRTGWRFHQFFALEVGYYDLGKYDGYTAPPPISTARRKPSRSAARWSGSSR